MYHYQSNDTYKASGSMYVWVSLGNPELNHYQGTFSFIRFGYYDLSKVKHSFYPNLFNKGEM